MITRPIRSGDVEAFYGEPSRSTIKGIVAELNGEVVGIIGIARDVDYGRFFSDVKPELTPYLRSMTIMRGIKQAMGLVREYKGPVGAVAEHAEGCRILNRLGFTHIQGALYGWLN